MQAEILTVACLLMMFWCVRLLLRAKDHFKAVNGIAVGDNENPGNVPPETPAANSPAAGSQVTPKVPTIEKVEIDKNDIFLNTETQEIHSKDRDNNDKYTQIKVNDLITIINHGIDLYRQNLNNRLNSSDDGDVKFCNNVNSNLNCDALVNKLLCPISCKTSIAPAVLEEEVPISTNVDQQSNPASCVDTRPSIECAVWAQSGYCYLNSPFYQYMQKNCCATCTAKLQRRMPAQDPAGPPQCVDTNPTVCGVWAATGQCNGPASVTVRQQCPLSCNACPTST